MVHATLKAEAEQKATEPAPAVAETKSEKKASAPSKKVQIASPPPASPPGPEITSEYVFHSSS